MNDPVAVGIEKIIEENGLQKKFVAKKSGFTQNQLGDMLHGRKTIKASYMPRLAAALGVSIQDIYDAGWNDT